MRRSAWHRTRIVALSVAATTVLAGCLLISVSLLAAGDPDPRTSLAAQLQRRCRGKDLGAMALALGASFEGVEIRTFGGVRGLGATRSITRGETIISLPRSSLFSYSNVEQSLRALWDVKPEIQELDRVILLFMREAARPAASPWDFYLCGIPGPDALGPPILWDRPRLNKFCTQRKYEVFCDYVHARVQYYRSNWDSVVKPLIVALPSVFPARMRTLTFDDYAWALAAVLSRMWNMRDEDALEFFPQNGSHVGEDKWVMAPYAELLNHQPGAGHIQWMNNSVTSRVCACVCCLRPRALSHAFAQVASGIFTVVSDRDYATGDQVSALGAQREGGAREQRQGQNRERRRGGEGESTETGDGSTDGIEGREDESTDGGTDCIEG